MKILYAIQGTGNGHIARAREIVPILREYADVDLLLSGSHSELTLPWPIKYRLKGLGFIFGKSGGIDYWRTLLNTSIYRFLKEIFQLPLRQYDMVISDFEPVSAWACKLRGKNCIGISHQAAILHRDSPMPRKIDLLGKLVLRYYAPSRKKFGFHFKPLDQWISTPVIRKDIRNSKPVNGGHYTVYLPAFDDLRVIRFLARYPEFKWEVFSKHSKNPYSFQNIKIRPVNQVEFTASMVRSSGVFCTAGFETPAEALFLRKKLCVIPMRGQFEQQCNAAMLQSMGVTVVENMKEESSSIFEDWLQHGKVVDVKYPDNTRRLLERILEEASGCRIEYFPVAGAVLMR